MAFIQLSSLSVNSAGMSPCTLLFFQIAVHISKNWLKPQKRDKTFPQFLLFFNPLFFYQVDSRKKHSIPLLVRLGCKSLRLSHFIFPCFFVFSAFTFYCPEVVFFLSQHACKMKTEEAHTFSPFEKILEMFQ